MCPKDIRLFEIRLFGIYVREEDAFVLKTVQNTYKKGKKCSSKLRHYEISDTVVYFFTFMGYECRKSKKSASLFFPFKRCVLSGLPAAACCLCFKL
jgi:hypothetical protein